MLNTTSDFICLVCFQMIVNLQFLKSYYETKDKRKLFLKVKYESWFFNLMLLPDVFQ